MIIGTEFGYWQSRYLTQTSVEERAILEVHVRVNGGSPIYKFNLENQADNFYRPDFMSFVYNILVE
jgi:hypothetical protein